MIDFKNVSFEYEDGAETLSELNLSISDGQVILLCGESGCGKSTLIRMINGLIPNYYKGNLTGTVAVNGLDTSKVPLHELAEHVSSVFQNPKTQFYNVDSTEEMVFGLENRGVSREEMKERLSTTVKKLRLENLLGRNLFKMSGGEKQKVACACADTSDTDIIVLDEPSSNLDLHTINELARIIKIWKAAGKTVVIAEHRLYYVLPIADRVIYMKHGHIEAEYTPNELLALGKEKMSEMCLRSTDILNLPLKGAEVECSEKVVLANFHYTYPGRLQQSLDVPYLRVSRHAVIGIVGDNGAGKSTFARNLCGLERRATGNIEYDGSIYARRKRLRSTFMVMQDVGHQLFTDDVEEEMVFSLEKEDENSASEINSVLEELHLLDKKERHPQSLSGGEKQRVAIGSAVVSNRDLIVFDEPTSGLDYRNMKAVSSLVKDLKDKGKTIFIVTHDPELIAECCDELIYMQDGKVLECGKLNKELYDRWLYRTSTLKEKKTVSSDDQLTPLKRMWQLAYKEHPKLILSIVLAIIGVLGSVLPYIAAARVIANLLEGVRDIKEYIFWCIFGAVGFVIKPVFYSLGLGVSHRATFNTLATIRKAMFDKLPRMPLGTIIDASSGKLKQIIVDEVESMERPLAHMIPEMTANILGAISIWAYLMYVDWRMGLIALISVPIGLLFAVFILIGYATDYEKSVRTIQDMNRSIVEYIHGIEVIKAYNQSEGSFVKFKKRVMATAQYYYDWMKRIQYKWSLTYAMAPATLVTVLPIGWIMYTKGTLDAGTFMTSIMLSMCIVGPIMEAISFSDTLTKVKTTVGTVDEILNGSEQIHGEEDVEIKDHSISMTDVSYSYHEGIQVLHDINLKIPKNTMTALVGPSGSGKSTIAKLIAGFWDVEDGKMTLGGINYKDIPLKQLYDRIAFVSQDIYLFDDTVMNNIRMGRMNATDEEVIAAAESSGCKELIANLAEGYNTMVGQGGTHLSGGEKQRIAIARAMIKDAPIVILDEATAYIDPENEAIIQKAIGNLIKGKTVIVVAHRLSTIVDADQIVVVDKGTICASGTHEELLKSSDLYRSMWNAHIGAGLGGVA
ncbi:MAG: ATP-binding cassette domain-containing protein [Lachnospiraceae bacterium]|nr:ATP-binding cassette domain-containing protein [Lachnospiraceae bacterium]